MESTPSLAKALSSDGYNQTYVITSEDFESSTSLNRVNSREVLFRCGNWCYKGHVQFNDVEIGISKLTLLISVLQKQQNNLRYHCDASKLPINSPYYEPVKFFNEAVDFISKDISSDRVQNELKKMSNIFNWIDDDDDGRSYFELNLTHVPKYMNDVALIASKTYTRGLIIISIYYEATIFFVILSGEGDQGLLDVRFPDVCSHGQGVLVSFYESDSTSSQEEEEYVTDHKKGDTNVTNRSSTSSSSSSSTYPPYHKHYRKLTLWQSFGATGIYSTLRSPRSGKPQLVLETSNVSSDTYEQTYCILREPLRDGNASSYRDVLFRFGSWCYTGRVRLTRSELGLDDIPLVIPALRAQQSLLEFAYETSSIPITSPFASCLTYIHDVMNPCVRKAMIDSESALQSLIDRLSNLGLDASVRGWLEGSDADDSFFEFTLAQGHPSTRFMDDIELVATKSYDPSGVCVICILHQSTVYVVLRSLETGYNIPLLDSAFPNVAGKGRGYILKSLPNGEAQWHALRKVSVWQSSAALQKEYELRLSTQAQGKSFNDTHMDKPKSTALREISTTTTVISTSISSARHGDEILENSDRSAKNSDSKASYQDAKQSIMALPSSSSSSSSPRSSPRNESAPVNTTDSIAVSSSSSSTDHKQSSIVTSLVSNTITNTNATVSSTSASTGANTEPHHTPPLSLESVAKVIEAERTFLKVALPHHLPPLAKLKINVDEKLNKAPWDNKGKPTRANTAATTTETNNNTTLKKESK